MIANNHMLKIVNYFYHNRGSLSTINRRVFFNKLEYLLHPSIIGVIKFTYGRSG